MALKNLFRRFIPALTTSAILRRFQKLIERLRAVHEAHINLADHHEEQASTHLGFAAAARQEANRAVEAIERLESVFGSH